ncbi:hypothetical protein AAFF_G00273320 [Aldrovandia affinis]|uniref:Uncharacterized protein n=1 Tax=Aldrovandia affinis TaxID=143900 RepID=A0AAD7WSK7_9TELE|nr:hypothetical protein AAFF_G00273320 [Aldrovandia affinis]
MKFLASVIFTAIIFQVSLAKKLRLITGLNGGLVTGVNPGLLVGGVQPAFLGGGLGVQPALLGGGLGVQPAILGGNLLAQPQLSQMIPGYPTYMVPPQGMPFGVPNLGAPQQQFPGQGGLPGNGINAFGGQMGQMGQNQPQQQGAQGNGGNFNDGNFNGGNFNQQQGPALPGPLRRIKRSNLRKACNERPSVDSQIPTQITPTPTAAEENTSPNTA